MCDGGLARPGHPPSKIPNTVLYQKGGAVIVISDQYQDFDLILNVAVPLSVMARIALSPESRYGRVCVPDN